MQRTKAMPMAMLSFMDSPGGSDCPRFLLAAGSRSEVNWFPA
jgi:hypothetical protein